MARVLTLSLLLAGTPVSLMAYTDPGTGMLFWQSVMAVSIGFLFTTRRVLAKVFRRHR